jgi:hypothetical protein
LLKGKLAQTVRYLRANALALIALFVALGGTGYAAAGLPTQSASNRQPKLTAHGQVVAWAVVNYKGHVVAGGARPRVRVTGTGDYTVTWRQVPTFPSRKVYCAAPVTVDTEFSGLDVTIPAPEIAGYADVNTTGHVVYVQTFTPSGQPFPLGFEVALICPGT